MSVSAWVTDRVSTDRVHLDVAACGRISQAALEVEVAHLQREAEVGGYVAEAEAEATVTRGREALGAMVGLDGSAVFLSEGAAPVFAALLAAWPLERGARIGVVPSEYGGNARVLRSKAAVRGWELVSMPVDPLGRIADVPDGLDLVTFPQVPSQRGITQPVEDVLATGVPLLLDVAQSLGQVEVPPGAAAYAGTSRKWLCGPRGVGFGIVDPAWHDRLPDPPTLGGLEHSDLRRFDSSETHVAGRVGLALAARTWSPALLPVLQAASAAARVLLEGVAGWQVVEPVEEPTGITTLRHESADAFATRDVLVKEGFVVSALPTSRADDVDVPLLRVSTAAWVTPGDLDALAAALERCTR
ncbi:MAG: aminotransferase class [Frankiales bacterium]|nr:aminotransferase class [Frankiales bacterium]